MSDDGNGNRAPGHPEPENRVAIPGIPFTLDGESHREIQSNKLPKAKKQAPVFDGKQSDELIPWISEVEGNFVNAGINSDEAKKYLALSWMEYKTRLEWNGNEAVRNGTWEEMKAALKRGYPDASSLEKGSKRKLKQLVDARRIITKGQLQRLQSFGRAFMVQASQLMEGRIPVLSNHEAVQYYLYGLEQKFVESILEKVEADPANDPIVDDDEPPFERREDDPYLLIEIMLEAEHQAKTYVGYNYTLLDDDEREEMPNLGRAQAKVKPVAKPRDEWEAKVSASKDRHDLEIRETKKEVKGVDLKLDQLQESFRKAQSENKALLEQLAQSSMRGPTMATSGPGQYNRFPPRPNNSFPNAAPYQSGPGGAMCFFCKTRGHIMPECEHLQHMMSLEIIKRNEEGKYVMRNGWAIPRDDAAQSKKDKVEEFAKAHGWYDLSSLFYEEPAVETYVAIDAGEAQEGTPLDAIMSALQEMKLTMNSHQSEVAAIQNQLREQKEYDRSGKYSIPDDESKNC